jgi:hypothetical protein
LVFDGPLPESGSEDTVVRESSQAQPLDLRATDIL